MPYLNPTNAVAKTGWYHPPSPMPTAPARPQTTGDMFRGGAFGVQSDYGLRDMFANNALGAYGNDISNKFNADMAFNNQRNGYLGQAGGMVTNAQVERSRGDLMPVQGRFQNLADHGKYSTGEYDSILMDRYNQARAAKEGIQKTLNAQLSSMGLGLNPALSASMGFAGEFAAAGQRGEAKAGLDREQADSRVQGLQGMSQIAQQLAAMGMQPTQENMLAMIAQMHAAEAPQNSAAGVMSLYDQYRNAPVGPGAGLQTPPAPHMPAPGGGGYGGYKPPKGGMVTW